MVFDSKIFRGITKTLGADSLVDSLLDNESNSKSPAQMLRDMVKNKGLTYYQYPLDAANFDDSYISIYINKNVKEPNSFDYTGNKNELYQLNPVDDKNFVPTKSNSNVNNVYKSNTGGYQRIDKVISLYIPDNLESSVEHNWSAEETRTAQNVMNLIGSAMDIGASIGQEGFFDKLSSEIDSYKPQTKRAAMELILGSSGKAYYAGQSKDIVNPRTEFLFSSTSPRSFNYTFKMTPRSLKELQSIHSIIKLLKFHSYGSLAGEKGNSSFLNYPSTFDIKYYTGAKENKHFINSTSCALTNITENLTGSDGIYSVFEKELMAGTKMQQQDIPTSVILSLTFMELEIIDKQRFLELNL